MVQVSLLVAFGVLSDTLVVRSLLVPTLVVDSGPRRGGLARSPVGMSGDAAAPEGHSGAWRRARAGPVASAPAYGGQGQRMIEEGGVRCHTAPARCAAGQPS
ncbi:hypothetical protein ACH4Q6_25205 [Streptomyces lydicus]|uniref:hypothetical protein n=1 Tax=Streptomyces lydicus TaxID=47763 RepID=UPI0037A9165E